MYDNTHIYPKKELIADKNEMVVCMIVMTIV